MGAVLCSGNLWHYACTKLEAGTLDYANCAGSGASYKLFPEAYLKMEQAGQKENSMITGAYNEGITGAQTSKALVIEEKQPSFQGTY